MKWNSCLLVLSSVRLYSVSVVISKSPAVGLIYRVSDDQLGSVELGSSVLPVGLVKLLVVLGLGAGLVLGVRVVVPKLSHRLLVVPVLSARFVLGD